MKKLLLIGLLTCSAAHAEFFDGNKLLARLKGDSLDYVQALGYITGVADAMRGISHCPPDNVTAGQLADMVKNHLEASPAARHYTGDQHVVYVLKRAWPCAERRGGQSL